MSSNYVIFVVILTTILIYEPVRAISKTMQVDLVIQDLEDQIWLENDQQCIHDTLNILNNVKNHTLWAVWIWNSMQYPTGTFYGSKYSFGNFDQCLKAPSVIGDPKMLTQYCLADIRLTDEDATKGKKLNPIGYSDEFLKVKSEAGRNNNLISWGTCLPATCNPPAVTKILKSIYLVNPIASADPDITIDNCQLAEENTVYSSQFYSFLIIMTVLVLIAIFSSIYLQYTTKDTVLTRMAYSCSLQRNWSSLVRTSGEEIAFLNFTKSAQILVSICTHHFMFILFFGAASNGVEFDNKFIQQENMLDNLFQHIDLPALDNFLVISGILIMKSLMENKKNPITALIQRFMRLIGPLSFLVFFTLAVLKYTGNGPLWKKLIDREQKACEQNWIWTLLMLNNYVNTEEMCQVVTWYTSCDFQLAVMATTLYCVWQLNRRAGKFITFLTSVLALILPGIVTYRYQIPGLMLSDVEQFRDARSNENIHTTYMKSHHRAGPYLIGMAMGYILTVYKPAKYRGVISNRWCYIGFFLAGSLGLKVWTSAGAWCLGDYNAWNSAVYVAFNRNIWAISTCICIITAEYGDIPKLQSLFAWPGFVIISRLGFGVYIIHPLIMERNIYSQRNPIHFDIFRVIVDGLGGLAASFILAVLLWLFVEAPVSNLTNLILAPRKQLSNGVNDVIKTKADSVNEETKNGKHV